MRYILFSGQFSGIYSYTPGQNHIPRRSQFHWPSALSVYWAWLCCRRWQSTNVL